MRRTLIITAGAIVLVGVGVVVYYTFFASSGGLAVAPTAGATLPGAASNPATAPPDTGAAAGSLAATRVNDRLVEISQGPVVPGEVALDVVATTSLTTASSTSASSTPDIAIRYIEQESGNIFSYLVRAGTLTRISNKTLPGIEAAHWLPSGATAFTTYLAGSDSSIVTTYGLASDGSTGFFLPQGLADISVAATGVLTLASGTSGSVASLLHPDGSHAAQAFTTPLSSLRASFAPAVGYLAFTKPSSSLPGYAYTVSTAGQFTRIAGPLPGLVALASPSGKLALVSYSTAGVMHMELVDTKTGGVTPLPVATIADKCVWTLDDSAIYCGIPVAPPTSYSYPDDWYQGAISFNDRLWKIDVAGKYAQLVLDFGATTNAALDAENLTLDPKSTVLVFRNKNDGSLWSYSL